MGEGCFRYTVSPPLILNIDKIVLFAQVVIYQQNKGDNTTPLTVKYLTLFPILLVIMYKKWIVILIIALIYSPAFAANYYVATTGSSDASGLDSTNAWSRLDAGDSSGVLLPGDTVFIYPGTYDASTSINLKTSGTELNPIVYQKIGRGDVIVDGNNQSITILLIDSGYVKISGIHFTNSKDEGIISTANHIELNDVTVSETDKEGYKIYGDSCLVTRCKIYNSNNIGLRIYGNYNTFYRNIVYSNDEGIKNEDDGSLNNLFYHNVIYDNNKDGIELKGNVESARLFNNIIISNGDVGIRGPVENICAFNNVWGNLGGNYDGVVDSAGGISSGPIFFDQDNGVGIPEEIRTKLFHQHLTTKKDGHGYGLVTVSKILENHNATVDVESTVGVGSTFTIKFPRTSKE